MNPSSRSITLLLIVTGVALLSAVYPGVLFLWKITACLAAGLLIVDFYTGQKTPDIELRRSIKRSVSVGVWSRVTLEIKNLESRSLNLVIHDHHPASCEVKNLPITASVPANRILKLQYSFRPNTRGDILFSGLDLLIDSPMKLWRKKTHVNQIHQAKVFPNFREIKKYAMLATDNRLSQIGIRRKQRRGEGNDFHQLREYRSGDTIRQIDWKSTSRYQKLISKEYQDERDQQVIFLLDCGRRMRHAEQSKSHLDQALNAMLLLAYVASRQEDAIGFMAFGGVHRWVPPQKSGNTVKELLGQVYDLHSNTNAADYLTAARELLTLQKRRALIVILTNTRDEDHEDLTGAIHLLKKKHLVVLADLREEVLDEAREKPVSDMDSALRFQSVMSYLSKREKNHNLLRHHGVLTLDILASQLPAALVNEYLMIKAAGRL